MIANTDIDIDFADRNDLLDKLKHRIAKLDNGKKHKEHMKISRIQLRTIVIKIFKNKNRR